ncbi:magnesium transporter NIPA-domain-containing protein [Entophlyctis helioformis]|nr:magnesium transporter NIPA-domain-containing protein [Entophlyctis helioformis]
MAAAHHDHVQSRHLEHQPRPDHPITAASPITATGAKGAHMAQHAGASSSPAHVVYDEDFVAFADDEGGDGSHSDDGSPAHTYSHVDDGRARRSRRRSSGAKSGVNASGSGSGSGGRGRFQPDLARTRRYGHDDDNEEVNLDINDDNDDDHNGDGDGEETRLLVSDDGIESSRGGGVSETAYLGEKMWWFGMAVMFVGELGNFAAYGFAPAVLVAPLGTVALISNALIAPVFLGENIRSQDILGILFSIIGTGIILAVSSQTSEPALSPDDILFAITQTQFIVYFIVTASVAVFMIGLSQTPQGRKYIFIDLIIVAVFGGYTVLATKALSSLLKLSFVIMISHWITYLALFVLASTAVMQVQHLNRALSAFDSVEVIPTNFVLFTTSSIVGSAILYNDLQRTNSLALLGVVCMFFGVILITGKRPPKGDGGAAGERLLVDDGSEGMMLSAGSGAGVAVDDDARAGVVPSVVGGATPIGIAVTAATPVGSLVPLPVTPTGATGATGATGGSVTPVWAASTPRRQPGSHHRRPPSSASDYYDAPGPSVSPGRGMYLSTLLNATPTHHHQPGHDRSGSSSRSRYQLSPAHDAASPQHVVYGGVGGGHGGHGVGAMSSASSVRSVRSRPSSSVLGHGSTTTTHAATDVYGSVPNRVADATFKGLSTVLNSVGTHQIRRMELDYLSDHSTSSIAGGGGGGGSVHNGVGGAGHSTSTVHTYASAYGVVGAGAGAGAWTGSSATVTTRGRRPSDGFDSGLPPLHGGSRSPAPPG